MRGTSYTPTETVFSLQSLSTEQCSVLSPKVGNYLQQKKTSKRIVFQQRVDDHYLTLDRVKGLLQSELRQADMRDQHSKGRDNQRRVHSVAQSVSSSPHVQKKMTIPHEHEQQTRTGGPCPGNVILELSNQCQYTPCKSETSSYLGSFVRNDKGRPRSKQQTNYS